MNALSELFVLFLIQSNMDLQPNGQGPQPLDSVAVALINALTLETEVVQENTIKIFITKVYKNNLPNVKKHMNSIRLNRFNALLYKINRKFPISEEANVIMTNSIYAAILNQENFLEEEDEDTIISIAKWICSYFENINSQGLHQSTLSFLNFLINGIKPNLLPLNTFQEKIRVQTYLNELTLSVEDERLALKQQIFYNITSNFNIRQFILHELNIQVIYKELFEKYQDKKYVLSLFNKHYLKLPSPKAQIVQLFQKTFLAKLLETPQKIEVILSSVQENFFNHQSSKQILKFIAESNQDISLLFRIQLKDTNISQLFLQLLKDFWKNKDIQIIIKAFLNAEKISNLIPLYLILNSQSVVPKKYSTLIFEQKEIYYQHSLVFALAVAHNQDKNKSTTQLIDLYINAESSLTPQRKSLAIKAIKYSLSNIEKRWLYSALINQVSAQKFGKDPSLDFVLNIESKPGKLTSQDKKKLIKILENHKQDSENMVKTKIQLFGVCNYQLPLTRRIRQMTAIFQKKSYEQIIYEITSEKVKKDPQFVGALLMGLNNKLKLSFIAQPEEKLLSELISLFIHQYRYFGKRVGSYENLNPNSRKNCYYISLFEYNILAKSNVGCPATEIGDLLSGNKPYNRVVDLGFSEYFINQEKNTGPLAELWNIKKIIVELYKLLKKVVNYVIVGNNSNKKQFLGVMNPEWKNVLTFNLVDAYFQAGIEQPQVLKQILQILEPQYRYFEKVLRLYQSQYDQYIDVLEYIPQLLRSIYPLAINFLSKLIESQPVRNDKDKDKEKEKDKKKNSKKKKNQNKAKIIQEQQSSYILQNQQLFQNIIKKGELVCLFGDSTQLQSFDPLFKIVSKINDKYNQLQKIINYWLPKLKIFHYKGPENFENWKIKLVSYCNMWKIILVDKKYKINVQELERHFHILTEFLNIFYENKKEVLQIEEKILMTLMIIYQASCQTSQVQDQKSQVPVETIRNFFLGFRISPLNEQHYYYCFTCKLNICQVCAPFLHKNHDVNYLGKDGHCVHDSNKKNPTEQKELPSDRYQLSGNIFQPPPILNNNRDNIFNAPTGYLNQSLSRNNRREQDFLMSTFQFPDEQMDFNEHLRFKQLMQRRLIDQKQKEREKQFLLIRQRERMERERQQLIYEIQREKDRHRQKDRSRSRQRQRERQKLKDRQDEKVQDNQKSESSKSIKNLHYCSSKYQYFEPQFTPLKQVFIQKRPVINTSPLKRILLRELQWQGHEGLSKGQSEKINLEISAQRYNFFNKSNFFKTNSRSEFGMMRGIGGPPGIVNKRNLLTNNSRFLAFPSPTNGILLLSMVNIIAKFNRRLNSKNIAEFQQERAYVVNNINNSNLSFEPFQIIFSKANTNILAIIGLAQLGFASIDNSGKIQKYMEADFKCSQPIIKFQWLGKQKNIFAVCSGSNIRIGSINEEQRVKTANKFRLHINKPIKDFEINVESGSLYAYVIDVDGIIYRSQFDYRENRVVNMSQKRINTFANIENLQSLIFVDKKLFLSASSGKCYLFKTQSKNIVPTLIQSFDLESAIKNNDKTKFLKAPFYLSHMKVIHHNDNTFSIGCIIKKLNGDPKKKGGIMAIARVSNKNNLDLIWVTQQESVQSFDITEISEHNFLLTLIDDNGSFFLFNYNIPAQLVNVRQETKVAMNDSTILTCNSYLKTAKLLSLAKYNQPRRYQNFKDMKDLTVVYSIVIDHPRSIKLSTPQPYKYFWTGLSFIVQPLQTGSHFILYFLGQKYEFNVQKTRQIQVPLTIKETLELFIQDGELNIYYQTNVKQVRNVKIFGIDFGAQSLYKRVYTQLHKIILTHMEFSGNNIEYFLENPEKTSLTKLNLCQFFDLKVNHKYTTKQLNLLMKLQLLRQSINIEQTKESQIQQAMAAIKCYLMPICQKRQYMQKSCWKLIRKMCQLMLKSSNGIVGHPYEYRTVLDFYYFERCYQQWTNSKHLNTFEQIVNLLYALIFKRIGNLYIVFKVYPNLIYELTYFYKLALSSLKPIKTNENSQKNHLNKLINICPNFVALVCQFYQTLKNSSSSQLVEQSQQQDKCPQKIVLDLLQEVFCATKKELYRQIFISPEMYLERLYLTERTEHPLGSAINIFQIKSVEKDQQNHTARKASLNIAPEQEQKSEEDIQLEQQSEKEMMMQQQAREMMECQLKESIIQEVDSKKVQTVESKEIYSNSSFAKINNILNNYLLNKDSKLSFVYYQFSFEMITALFNIDNLIKQENSVFYMGFLFNLLRIVEMNLQPIRDKIYLERFMDAVHRRLNSAPHSVLFMVLNYFLQPTFTNKSDTEKLHIEPAQTVLSKQFINYYHSKQINIEQVFINFKIIKHSKAVSMSQAMKFVPFNYENHLYQLKFLGSHYFNYVLSRESNTSCNFAFKEAILARVVRYNVRILKNIMYYHDWQSDLQKSRVEVGFQTLTSNVEEGIMILFNCAKTQSNVFIEKLAECPSKIEILEQLLGKSSHKQTQIMEMLTIYYSS